MRIARDAGRAILEVYGRADFSVARKSDDSPLTEADQVAHGIISQALEKLDAGLPILSEESLPADHAARREWKRYWLVDPLDGTKEFVKRNGEFTVNIALVDEHRAVLGAVYAPVLDRMYSGAIALGAWRSDGGGCRAIHRGPRRGRVSRCASSAAAAIQPPSSPRISQGCRRTRSPTWAAR